MLEAKWKSKSKSKHRSSYSFEEIFDYLTCGHYPPGADKQYKHGLRKRSNFFAHEEGRLFYLGGKNRQGATERRLVVMDVGERQRIISTIHDNGHLGRDKTLAQINAKYYRLVLHVYNCIACYLTIQNVLYTAAQILFEAPLDHCSIPPVRGPAL